MRHTFILITAIAASCASQGATATVPTASTTTAAATPAPADKAAPPSQCDATEAAEGSFGVLTNERIGTFAMGTAGADVVSKLGVPTTNSGPTSNEVEGGFDWLWGYTGVVFTMHAEKKDGDPSINAITITSRSQLKTRFGVGIGSAVADVETAYGPCISKEDSTDATVVAGSIYGGVLFTIKDGVVSDIFVGAAAE